jgi:chromosomal replication initiator protein
LESAVAHALWQDVLAAAERAVGARALDLWLRHAALVEADREEVVVVVSTPFERDRLEAPRLADALARAFEALLGARPRLRVEVDPHLVASLDARPPLARDHGAGTAGEAASAPPPKPPLARRQAFPDDMTFDGFVTGGANRLAREAAERVCLAPGGELNPLVLCGGCGSGKTHLLTAIARRLREEDPRCNVIFATAERFTNEFTAGIRNHRTPDFRERYRRADVLLVDDVHDLCSKPKTQLEFLHTFETLVNAQRQIVLTSEFDPKRLEKLHPGLAGRFLAGLVVALEPPDLETRRRIVEARARRLKLSLPRELTEFLAKNVLRPRDLCGALTILQAHAAIGERLDVGLAERRLGDILGPRRALAPEARVVEIVAEAFALEPEALLAARRADVARARQVAMVLVRRLTTLSLKEIGDVFGRKPSTVTFAESRIEARAAAEPALRETLAACTRRFRETAR